MKHIRKLKETKDRFLETQRLRAETEQNRSCIDSTRNHFEQAAKPIPIDCYIYELSVAQLRYQFLLRRFKSLEVQENRVRQLEDNYYGHVV